MSVSETLQERCATRACVHSFCDKYDFLSSCGVPIDLLCEHPSPSRFANTGREHERNVILYFNNRTFSFHILPNSFVDRRCLLFRSFCCDQVRPCRACSHSFGTNTFDTSWPCACFQFSRLARRSVFSVCLACSRVERGIFMFGLSFHRRLFQKPKRARACNQFGSLFLSLNSLRQDRASACMSVFWLVGYVLYSSLWNHFGRTEPVHANALAHRLYFFGRVEPARACQ